MVANDVHDITTETLMHPTIAKLMSAGPVVTDGAWGTQLQQRGLPVGACPDAWNLTSPTRSKRSPVLTSRPAAR